MPIWRDPAGNVTGMSLMAPELGGKRLELLKEVLPRLAHVAVLWNAASPYTPLEGQEVVVAAAASRIASAGGGPRLVDGAPALFRFEEAAGAAEVRIGLAAHGIFVAPALDRELGLCFLEAQAEILASRSTSRLSSAMSG